MTQSPELGRDPNIQEYIDTHQGWLADGVEVLGLPRDTDPLSVFPMAKRVRDDGEAAFLRDGELVPIPERAEQRLRELGGRFGIGGEYDLPSGADKEIIEGGKPWKIMAEAGIAQNERYYAGSDRPLGEDETSFLWARFGDAAHGVATEYQLARLVAENDPGFTLEDEMVLPFGYDIYNDHHLIHEPTGQLIRIGRTNGKPTYLVHVTVGERQDDTGETVPIKTDGTKVMGFVADVLSAQGDETSSVGMLTSSTYPSRAVDAMIAGLARKSEGKKERHFTIGQYSRGTLARMQTLLTERPRSVAPAPFNQLPGELHTFAEKLQHLQSLVATEQ